MSHAPANIGEGLVVAGILSKLPVKSILRFMSVCKSWHSLISSPYFISTQLGNGNNSDDAHLVVHQCDTRFRAGQPTEIHLFHLDGSNRHQPMSFNFGFESPRKGDLFVVGSVRGLICYAAVQVGAKELLSKFIIFNPDIESFISVPAPLPSLEYDFVAKGFGFDDVSLDFKIFVAVSNRFVYLFSLNSNSWSCMPCQNSWDATSGNAVFVKGCFHWLSCEYPRSHLARILKGYEPAVIVFNIRTRTFRRIPFQERLPALLKIIPGLGESPIAIIQQLLQPSSFPSHLWLMDRNGSWSKIADDFRSAGVDALGFKNKHRLLIASRSKRVILSQNIGNRKRHRVMSMEAGSLHCTLHAHVPSLVLLDRKIT